MTSLNSVQLYRLLMWKPPLFNGVFVRCYRRFRDAETRPSVVPRHRPGRAERACKRLPWCGLTSARGAQRPLAMAHRRRPGASRGCGVGNGGSLPWEGRAAGTRAKRPKISSSAGAVSRPVGEYQIQIGAIVRSELLPELVLAPSMRFQSGKCGVRDFHISRFLRFRAFKCQQLLCLGQRPSDDGAATLDIRPTQCQDLPAACTGGGAKLKKRRHAPRARCRREDQRLLRRSQRHASMFPGNWRLAAFHRVSGDQAPAFRPSNDFLPSRRRI